MRGERSKTKETTGFTFCLTKALIYLGYLLTYLGYYRRTYYMLFPGQFIWKAAKQICRAEPGPHRPQFPGSNISQVEVNRRRLNTTKAADRVLKPQSSDMLP